MNFAFGETVIHKNFAFKIKIHKPTQLAHNPEDIQEFVDDLDAWKTANREITKKK